MIFKKAMAYAAATVVGVGAMIGISTATADAEPPCVGSWSVGMGGFVVSGAQDSSYFGVNQPVGYNTYDPMGGYNELDRLVTDHRAACPGDHIKILGHSEGAAIVHAWAGKEGHRFDNTSLVLIGDPKRLGGIGLNGISELGNGWLGFPLAGNDDNYGGLPALQVCRWRDVICHNNWDWSGYFAGEHNWYPFAAHEYPTGLNDTWMW